MAAAAAVAAVRRALRSRRSNAWAALRPATSASHSLPRFLSSEPSLSLDRCGTSADILFPNPEIWFPRFSFIVRGFLAGVVGIGMLERSHADANEEDFQSKIAMDSPANDNDMYKIVSEERKRIEEVLKKKEMLPGSYPPFKVYIRGKEVVVKFRIPPTCNISNLLADIVARLGLKTEEDGTGSHMMLRSWNSSIAWQLTLSHPEQQDIHKVRGDKQKDNQEGALCVLMFESLITSEDTEIEFIKQGRFSLEEIEAVASALKIATIKGESKTPIRKILKAPSLEKTVAELENMGVRVFGLDETRGVPASSDGISWCNVAGYEEQKREIEDTIVLALQCPEVYDTIAHGTRTIFEPNRPRAVLFEGPPGTGKTSCARVIANQASIPLLYVPLEVVVSKYYGESERLLGEVFSLANKLPDGALIFLDEVDSLATDRGSEMHEATRRLLSVLLRQIDGFEQDKKLIIIAATNRKEDLDPALISRFDSMITFGLPDKETREKIVSQYAKHLTKSELSQLAAATHEMSGRDIRDICQQAERRWAAKIIRAANDLKLDDLPPIGEYLDCAELRRKAMREVEIKRATKRGYNSHLKEQRLALA